MFFLHHSLPPFQIPKGLNTYKFPNIFSNGRLPRKVMVVLCDPIALSGGGYHNNPHLFPATKYGLTRAQLLINDIPVDFEEYSFKKETFKIKVPKYTPESDSIPSGPATQMKVVMVEQEVERVDAAESFHKYTRALGLLRPSSGSLPVIDYGYFFPYREQCTMLCW